MLCQTNHWRWGARHNWAFASLASLEQESSTLTPHHVTLGFPHRAAHPGNQAMTMQGTTRDSPGADPGCSVDADLLAQAPAQCSACHAEVHAQFTRAREQRINRLVIAALPSSLGSST